VSPSYAWSPDGSALAYSASEAKTDARKARDKRLGDLERDDDHGQRQPVAPAAGRRASQAPDERHVGGGGFSWSPDGRRIAFDHQAHDALAMDSTRDISLLELANGRVTPLVTWKGPDSYPVWSPDGKTIAFDTSGEQGGWYYTNRLDRGVPAAGGKPTVLTRDFDEEASLIAWTPDGILMSASRRTGSYVYQLDPATHATTRLAPEEGWAGSGWNVTENGLVAVVLWRATPRTIPEVFVGRGGGARTRGHEAGRAARGLVARHGRVGGVDESRRRAHRRRAPQAGGLEAGRAQRPLLVVIHGGPTTASRPTRFASTYVYPIEHWLAKGALVLEPNYRGSAGYGAAFRALNVRNLGVGDAWDVVTGIESLVQRGLVDSTRVASMGWSQGGYISAFLATNESRRFRAISVGAASRIG
jgi:dipeptidyl aminopeptidase/acylaminoacyl peptidase